MEKNHSLKARMYLGGLKSLFADMHDLIEGVEKTGSMPSGMLQNLFDTKEAIDLTLQQLKRATVRCCDHDHNHSREEENENEEDEDDEIYCEDCDLSLEDCDCEEEEDEEEEEPEPEPQQKAVTKKPAKKTVAVVPPPTVAPKPASKKNKKETKH